MWLFGLKTKSILNQSLHLKRLILTALKMSVWFPIRSADKKYVIKASYRKNWGLACQ